MPMIGWIILLASLALILGNLVILRDTSNNMSLSGEKLEKLEKVRKRKAEQEALDKQDKQND